RLLRVQDGSDAIDEEDIELVIAHGREAGVVEPEEQVIVERAFWLGERRVNDIMTPRHEVAWLDARSSPDQAQAVIAAAPHGRYVVADGDLDHVVGYVSAADLLRSALRGEPLDLQRHLREPLFVPETMPILAMLNEFRETGERLAVVVDEYGGFEGLLTLGDILEELVGDLAAVGPEEPRVEEVAPGAWRVDGGVHVDALVDALGLGREVDMEHVGFQTAGGLTAFELGRVPAEGDAFEWHGHRFTVARMEGQRVAELRVVRVGWAPERTGPDADRTRARRLTTLGRVRRLTADLRAPTPGEAGGAGASYLAKWALIGLLVGVVAGLGAALFHFLLDEATHLLLVGLGGHQPPLPPGEGGTAASEGRPSLLLPLVVAAGGLVSGLVVARFAPEAEGAGTDTALEAVHMRAGKVRRRVPLVKLVASVVTIGSGGSGGREGPASQMSAGLASAVADW